MRDFIWNKISSSFFKEGEIIPRWGMIIKSILFPLKALSFHAIKNFGYQWDRDTWIIHGIHYSDQSFKLLSKANGEIYKITRKGNQLWLEEISRVPPAKPFKI